MADVEPWSRAICIQGLTARELEVVRCLMTGCSEKEAARQLGVSVHTVHGHVKTIYRALGVHSRSELLVRIFSNGEKQA